MLDITSDDIAALNDKDLRILVARLCEEDLIARGLMPSNVTWGGNQTAPDGGLDVRVSLPPGTNVEGFVPRPSTGFQVKKSDMPRGAIVGEMRPNDLIRPAIQGLADEGGAYVIVSSGGSTADKPLAERKQAMREALAGVANADRLYTDFYDRTRLATWARLYPGIVLRVKEWIGRSVPGWQAYGAWCGGVESVDAEYLIDEELRVHLGDHRDAQSQAVLQAIDEIRNNLRQPGKVLRLVGLSGIGKTRLIQALFDDRIGWQALPRSHAVYTNLSDSPAPPPIGMATNLIANRMQAVLIVDNCPSDLHRRLSDLCTKPDSTISVITVEYDVRDDQPEGTQVISLEASSPSLTQKLIRRRYPYISEVDAGTIANVSGGNARIAIALAEAVKRTGGISGLTNEDLFERLFWQNHGVDKALLAAAQVCSLVYSYNGEIFDGEEAELPMLAKLANQTPTELYGHVAELLRRDLVQNRGVWRAVLPHAIANRLAARALEDIPYTLINQHLVMGGNERLARSFSRRLSYLHGLPQAVEIVKAWLSQDGILGDVFKLNTVGQSMFENAAPVHPEAALLALERVRGQNAQETADVFCRHQMLLRSLAYDADLFERSIRLLAFAAINTKCQAKAKKCAATFISLFAAWFSGTHASIEQRLTVIEELLRSEEANVLSLGLDALDNLLRSQHFMIVHGFEFGARSRNYGYQHRSDNDVACWYGAALELIERLALREGILKSELSGLLAKYFRSLWMSMGASTRLDDLARKFAAEGFWRSGWVACRSILLAHKDQLTCNELARVSALEAYLRPSNLSDEVRAFVLGNRSDQFDLVDFADEGAIHSEIERLAIAAQELGEAVVSNEEVFLSLLPDLLRGGSRAWDLGRGMAAVPSDHRGGWEKLVKGLRLVPFVDQNIQILCGYLSKVWELDADLAHDFLYGALSEPLLARFIPRLEASIELDERSVERLSQALKFNLAPIHEYMCLVHGGVVRSLSGEALKNLILLIASQDEGEEVAFEILYMRIFSNETNKREHEPELLEAGRKLLQCFESMKTRDHDDYRLASIIETCLIGPVGRPGALNLTTKLVGSGSSYMLSIICSPLTWKSLFQTQTEVVLEALHELDQSGRYFTLKSDGYPDHKGGHPASFIPTEKLISWCQADPSKRYPFAASIVPFSTRPPNNQERMVWSEQALALLKAAPNPSEVLSVFIDHFIPTSWGGSLAVIIEENIRLLDDLDLNVCHGCEKTIKEANALLTQEVVHARGREMTWSSQRDERFE